MYNAFHMIRYFKWIFTLFVRWTFSIHLVNHSPLEGTTNLCFLIHSLVPWLCTPLYLQVLSPLFSYRYCGEIHLQSSHRNFIFFPYYFLLHQNLRSLPAFKCNHTEGMSKQLETIKQVFESLWWSLKTHYFRVYATRGKQMLVLKLFWNCLEYVNNLKYN